jgi:hypothetical protein
MTADSPAERVARGAQLLDQQVPGWAERIDLGRLDLADLRWCPLGQTYATHPGDGDAYHRGLDHLGLRSGDQCIAAGVYLVDTSGDELPNDDPAWAELDELWIDEIRKRTGGDQ